MKIEDIQHGGDHYKGQPKHLQPIWLATELGLNPMEYSILKYLLRHRRKGGIEDLKKMMHFGQMLIQQEHGVETELVYVDEELAVTCEQPPDPPQLFDCPFSIGDMICPKVNPNDHWYICAVMADSMLLQKPGRNEDFTVPAVYYDRWQLCTDAAEQPAKCPFVVGDKIRVAGDKTTVFHVTDVHSDVIQVHSQMLGRQTINRAHWGWYEVCITPAVDKPDATC
jgi:hypothetical protein